MISWILKVILILFKRGYEMVVLISGITGMIGGHFADKMRTIGYKTYGIARSSSASRMAAVQDPSIIRCDMTDKRALDDVIKNLKPDIVIHMAAQAFNGLSWKIEDYTHYVNNNGTLNLLQSCRKNCPEAKILLACSSAEYGDVNPSDCPLKENRMLRPITPYGVSKVVTELLGYQYYSNFKMKIYLPRLFIHVGTGHPPATAIQNFAMQLALIAKGKTAPTIKVGNLQAARDFIDVRDGVDAMLTLLEKGNPGDPVNICTGIAYSISDILKMLLEISGLDVKITQDKELLRPSDEPLLLGDNSKIMALGWKPKYTIKETLMAVYQDWQERCR
jgi:GDP-4-dehydro-6-deoxy-D-mannose reductase